MIRAYILTVALMASATLISAEHNTRTQSISQPLYNHRSFFLHQCAATGAVYSTGVWLFRYKGLFSAYFIGVASALHLCRIPDTTLETPIEEVFIPSLEPSQFEGN